MTKTGMTKTGYLTRIALAALAITGGCIVGIILDHYAALPPVDGGEREPEQPVEPRIVPKADAHDFARRNANDSLRMVS
jgi:hypothetical protein